MSRKMQTVLNYTQIHPSWESIMRSGKPTYSEILQGCNKTALFLSDVDAHLTFFELRRNLSIKPNVFLSTESMFQMQFKYSFGKWVPPTILLKMGGLEIGGFFDWWTNLIVNYMTKIRGGETADKPRQRTDLSGNISVIFIVLAVGLAFSVLGFVFELRFHVFELLGNLLGLMKRLGLCCVLKLTGFDCRKHTPTECYEDVF